MLSHSEETEGDISSHYKSKIVSGVLSKQRQSRNGNIYSSLQKPQGYNSLNATSISPLVEKDLSEQIKFHAEKELQLLRLQQQKELKKFIDNEVQKLKEKQE